MLIKTGVVWLWFGAGCLLLSGLLTSPMLLGKIVFLRGILPGIEWIRWSLAIHVILATVVWHMAVPIGLFYSSATVNLRGAAKTLEKISLIIVLVGAILMFAALPGKNVVPLMANYIPIITHPIFYFALLLIFLGLTVALIDGVTRFLQRDSLAVEAAISFNYQPLAMLGAIFFLTGIVALLSALIDARSLTHLPAREYFEFVMWGAGHLFQHSSAVFLICCWEILLFQSHRQVTSGGWQRHLILSAMFWPILAAPFLFNLPIVSYEYREGFTWLMRWGIFPGVSIYIACLIFKMLPVLKDRRTNLLSDYTMLALAGSIILMIAGMCFGALIEGSDLRVPGHYHASIGSVTVAFMALSVRLLSVAIGQGSDPIKWMRAAILIYVPGQLLFSGGMFIAGWFGVERKTYGSGIEIESAGQMTGMAILGVGGILAFIGGFCFAISIFRLLRHAWWCSIQDKSEA